MKKVSVMDGDAFGFSEPEKIDDVSGTLIGDVIRGEGLFEKGIHLWRGMEGRRQNEEQSEDQFFHVSDL